MITVIWPGGAGPDGTRLFFEAIGAGEAKVITHGLVVGSFAS